MEPNLPEPDIIITIEENTTEPFEYIVDEIRLWLANHNDREDILDGILANSDMIEEFQALQLLGPHPLLERQIRKGPPLRWMHLKLQLAGNPDQWLWLILRADNLYVVGFANQRPDGSVACYEITEETPLRGNAGISRLRLFPNDYGAEPLDWGLQYHQLLGLGPGRDANLMLQILREMLEDPAFCTYAIQFYSVHDPTTAESQPGQRILAGLIFKLAEFIRMKLSMETPMLIEKVWHYSDICLQMKSWKARGYDNTGWKACAGIGGPRDSLECVAVVLNKSHGAFVFAEDLKRKKEKEEKKQHLKVARLKDLGAPEDPESMSGSSTFEGGTGITHFKNHPMENSSHIPFGRRRIQILSIHANFAVDDINVFDWHRGQKIYVNSEDTSQSQASATNLVLCGPRRAIGAYGYFSIEIFPTEVNIEPTTKRRKNATGKAEVSNNNTLWESWDFSCNYDTQPSKYDVTIHGTSGQRVDISYLHIPNTIEAQVKIRLYCNEPTELYGFIKATATGYGGKYLELFTKREVDALYVHAGEWMEIPLMMDILCLPYCNDLKLTVDIELNTILFGDRSSSYRCSFRFHTKYGNQRRNFDDDTLEVIVTMYPDPIPAMEE